MIFRVDKDTELVWGVVGVRPRKFKVGDCGMTLTLPYPPSVNRYWRMGRGHMHISTEGKNYKRDVAVAARGAKPIDGPVHVTLRVYRPRKSGDLDNTQKAIFDALKGVAFHDDSQIVCIEAHRFDDKENPRAEVEVRAA